MMKSMLSKALLVASLIASQAVAEVKVSDAKARATFAMATTGAVYMTLNNNSNQPDTLLRVEADKKVAASAEIHTVIMQDEMMQMRQLEDGLELPAKAPVTMRPGGFHIMLMGLTHPLREGQEVSLTLIFEKSRPVQILAPIVKM